MMIKTFFFLSCSILVISLWTGDVRAEDDPEAFPANIIHIPMFHSRPLFLRNFRPESVKPVKKVSINEPRIAEVKVITPYELIIDARYFGSTTMIIWYEDNSVDFFEIRVSPPRPRLTSKMTIIKGTKIFNIPKLEW